MAIKNNMDYLHLIWQNTKTRKNYIIGTLSRNGCYSFEYFKGVSEIDGFQPLIPFPDLKKTYENDVLFPIFSSRLPDPKRADMNEILMRYGLASYDAFELLKKSGAKLPYDSLMFIDPILNGGTNKRTFYIAGTRYYIGCDGKDCKAASYVKNGDLLFLKCEPGNIKDKYAVQILKDNSLIGYVPTYYSEVVFNALQRQDMYQCYCIESNRSDENCSECLKVELVINIE